VFVQCVAGWAPESDWTFCNIPSCTISSHSVDEVRMGGVTWCQAACHAIDVTTRTVWLRRAVASFLSFSCAVRSSSSVGSNRNAAESSRALCEDFT